MAQLQDPSRFKALNRGEQVAADTPPKSTIKFEDPQSGEMFSEMHPEHDAPDPSQSQRPAHRSRSWRWRKLDLEPGVYVHEGSEMLARLRDQLVMLPELSELHPECDIDQADVGVPGETSPEDESRMRAILKRHRKIFLGDGNAAPAPARGVVCDLDVGDAKPIARVQGRLDRT
ncbi:Eukaryotic/viral aspartic protease [Phytophthora megakarya]|uniref:Eukaryotic/viral aspartic protease n=1 Tax=Phytophthora megakarya TaxID=4795 RepID=A0A225UZA7_9STRA|nr:Eukaryotic/viral aspartic protease [Phytophthora megakarya]